MTPAKFILLTFVDHTKLTNVVLNIKLGRQFLYGVKLRSFQFLKDINVYGEESSGIENGGLDSAAIFSNYVDDGHGKN